LGDATSRFGWDPLDAGEIAGSPGIGRHHYRVRRKRLVAERDRRPVVVRVHRLDRTVERDRRARRPRALVELCSDRAHARGGDDDLPFGERLERILEDGFGGRQRPIERDASIEGREEALDEALREAALGEIGPDRRIARVALGTGEDLPPALMREFALETDDAQGVREPDVRVRKRRGQESRGAERIGEYRPASRTGDRRPRSERLQGKRLEVEFPSCGAIGREKHLEAAVEDESFPSRGANPAAGLPAPFENSYTESGVGEATSRGQPGETGTDDDRIGHISGAAAGYKTPPTPADRSGRFGTAGDRALRIEGFGEWTAISRSRSQHRHGNDDGLPGARMQGL
jgi:hypothetical protein